MSEEGGRAERRDPWLAWILVLSLLLSAYHLQWGLPNGNRSWAADALGPVTVLGVVRRSFGVWNSGWFYFKYALGYPLVLAALYAPYLGYLLLSGAWSAPTSAYPYGFADPEHSLFVLHLLGRGLNVLLTMGIVLLTYAIARSLGNRVAARLSACLVAASYPLVFYAHTTNVDTAYVFWLTLALWCALQASESERWLPWAGLGFAAAMAFSTKEQGFSLLLPLPLLVLAARARAAGTWRVRWGRPALIMAASAVITVLLANNALYNPLGFVGRLAFVIGRPLKPIAVRLLSVEFSLFKGAKELIYVDQLWDCLDSAFGSALAWLVLAGAVAVWRRPRAALWLLAPTLTYYYLSLRGMGLITLRYTLPLLVIGAVLASLLLADLAGGLRSGARLAVYAVMAVLVMIGIGRAIELNVLLRNDPRYAAESWLAAQLPAAARGEYYQKPAYLPRMNDATAHWVPIQERSIAAVERRRPDFMVLSAVSRKSISHIWNPDWRSTGTLLLPVPEAERFLGALEEGTLGYREAAVFRRRPRWFRSRITSLSPTTMVYQRVQGFEGRNPRTLEPANP